MDGGENDKEECLFLFSNRISLDIIYIFIDYRLYSGNDDTVKIGIMKPARLYVSIRTVLTCLEQEKS